MGSAGEPWCGGGGVLSYLYRNIIKTFQKYNVPRTSTNHRDIFQWVKRQQDVDLKLLTSKQPAI